MSDYIPRKAAIDAIKAMEWHDFGKDHFPDAEYAYNDGLIAAMNAVAAVPAADVVTWEQLREAWRIATYGWTRRGHWIRRKEYDGVYDEYNEWCECSECGHRATAGLAFWDNETPYCPWCGAKMMEGDYANE